MEQNLKTQLVRSIFQFKRLVSTGFGMDMAKDGGNINMSEFILMNGISDNTANPENNVDMSEIREYLAVSKAAISQMLASLEKKGYINRDIDRNNRRNLIVTLTSEGREVLNNKYEEFSNRLEKIISHLGEDEVKQMMIIVNRMIEITDKFNSDSKE